MNTFYSIVAAWAVIGAVRAGLRWALAAYGRRGWSQRMRAEAVSSTWLGEVL